MISDHVQAELRRAVLDAGQRTIDRIVPRRFGAATADHPQVAQWVAQVIAGADTGRGAVPLIRHGRSLLLCGPTGTGKTYQAFGALKALLLSGVRLSTVVAVNAADLYASLRPQPGANTEAAFLRYAAAGLLVWDDLGSAKSSEWTEEIDNRLVNHRYEAELPTIITTNAAPSKLPEILGARVASRLAEMCDIVPLKGGDRRVRP